MHSNPPPHDNFGGLECTQQFIICVVLEPDPSLREEKLSPWNAPASEHCSDEIRRLLKKNNDVNISKSIKNCVMLCIMCSYYNICAMYYKCISISYNNMINK